MGKSHLKIGVDLTGGDHPPELLFSELLSLKDCLDSYIHLFFFAPGSFIKNFERCLASQDNNSSLSFIETKESISMSDHPLAALRRKKDSPTVVALKHLKAGLIDALVSTGNTGALVSGATVILKRIKGIKRPGLLTMLPTLLKPLVVIDVGASVHSTSSHLVQFAKMGIAYQKCLGIAEPKVGLLNIGTEKEKGRTEFKEAYKKLLQLNTAEKSVITFVGNIEGKKAFKGDIDVLVTEGFSGNIFLKTAEGITAFILEKILQEELSEHTKHLPSTLIHLLNYAEYPGAIVCGVEGIVIKCHGDSSAQAIISGIKGAHNLVKTQFLTRLKKQLKV
jgi:glycerol-3-phosphate acyltransferase PlsX